MHGNRFVVATCVFFAPLFCGVIAEGQTLDQIAVSAKLQGESFGHAQVDMTLINGTQKTITAWAWSVEARYVDGSTRSHVGTVDVVTDLLLPNKDRAFRSGTSRTFEDSLPLGPQGDPPTSAVASLTMVVFADQTAIGDRLEIGRLAALRKSLADLEAHELQDIQKALNDPSPKEALRVAVAEREAKGQGDAMMSQILTQLKNNVPSEAVASAMAGLRTYQVLLASQSTLEAK